ncbi:MULTISPECIES: amino acid ABC transporter substrate-binding protein [Comamonas]|jgi:glutamate/aspartate transport system substrate-binding protein|uniref:Glutamate/aspartate periplasmic-binding protein n=1 Tax=Comamonas aquatica TaxID=225991 RepID=A0AA35D6C2_9BURK|nr:MULTISPECIES: amino acid ABC transporter substrate-binding protein [Comamonas]MRT20313.1 amino acid ABC transporter substrate-binding protein [Comamonas sp. CAH-2]CAB5647705.1 Glutamate/aspartate periplasmic-binding protein precursor [Comamonas aquatica]CAB5674719.1 Glutamate/aspartate periplasmic-binding protein precursor [Comamonas aquatica]CAC9171302.1 Glutamate/aspartate periplasmic-binding protein precursor [Comamonas aquatica]CAC9680925.1 Glutamate/aspartate periplasmic-binding protei
MKSVVKFSLLSAAIVAAVFSAAAHAAPGASDSPTLQRWQAGGTVVLGVRESATPMAYALGANEKFVGYHVELCEKVVRAIAPQAQLKYMVLTAQNTMPLIQNGTADFNCASMTNSLKRQDQVAFGLTTYVSEVRMAVAQQAPITSFKQLDGKKVSAITGTTAVQILRRYAAEHSIQFQTLMAKDQFEAFLLLESGRVDAFVLDDNMLAGVIAQSKHPAGYKIVGEVIGAEPIAIQFSKQDPAIKQAVDGAIRQMMANGEIERLYAKWYTQPIPPKQVNLNLPMGSTLKKLLAQPNDVPVEQFQP